MNLNVHLPINNLSFGYVAYHLLRELYLRKDSITTNWSPLHNSMDFGAFDKADPEFLNWARASAGSFLKSYKADFPTLKLWHIRDSHENIGTKNVLFTFHETDQLTPIEVNILNQQKAIIVSSEHSKEVFEDFGVRVPVYYVPLGFDSVHFRNLGRKSYNEDMTCWFIGGKAEMRKGNIEAAKLWVKKYGNDDKHILHLMVFNPFLEQMRKGENERIINDITENKKFRNVVSYPYMPTLSQVNEIYNATDIVIDVSRGEGWSLPSFNTLALGKHAVIHNCSAMKGWANDQNSVLVQSNGKLKAADGVFFAEGTEYNVGNFYNWNPADVTAAFDTAFTRRQANRLNTEGLKIAQDFTWNATMNKILAICQSIS